MRIRSNTRKRVAFVSVPTSCSPVSNTIPAVWEGRAPGFAPVIDACGQAGGKYAQTPIGGDSVFYNTSLARMGDLGSRVLPRGEPQAVWKAGSAVEVMWGMRFNHGGGYSYRTPTGLQADA